MDIRFGNNQIGNLTDVDVVGAGNGDVLVYSDVSEKWEAQDISIISDAGVSFETFSFSDDSNYVAGPLAATPTTSSKAKLWYGGVAQQYTLDFTIRLVVGGTDPGYYICLSGSSTPPGGGNFSGGNNPGTGLVSMLETGDILDIVYPIVN